VGSLFGTPSEWSDSLVVSSGRTGIVEEAIGIRVSDIVPVTSPPSDSPVLESPKVGKIWVRDRWKS